MSLLGDRLRMHAAGSSEGHAVHDDRWWTYSELIGAAEPIAQRIAALGLGPGDVVALAIDRGIEAVLALCATALAGAIPAVLDPRDPIAATRTIAALRPALVMVAPQDARLPSAHVVELRAGRGELAVAAAIAADPLRRDAGISHIIFTSGSTAAAKGVVWSELRAGFDWLVNAPRVQRRDKPGAIVAPLCTGLGFTELAHALYHGTSTALIHAPFMAALAEIHELHIDHLHLTPSHVELLLATAQVLPEVGVMSIATAPIDPERMRALQERVPNARLCRSYGLTESGPASAVWLHQNPRKLHTVGRAVTYRRITVRDPDGKMLRPDEPGEVVIEMPMWDTCDGYLDAPPELARRFTNGVLWTGDRGTIDRHGFLVLAGRRAEVLKIGGRSVSALRIEEALATLPQVRELAIVGVPDRWLGEAPCAVYVPTARSDPRSLATEAAARTAVAEETPKWWLARRELPRGPTQKLRRGLLAREAARWTAAFPQAIAATRPAYPACDLDAGVAIIDGCPWAGEQLLDPCARAITLATRRPLRAVALAAIEPGEPGVPACFIIGPIVPGELAASDALLDGLVGKLVELASLVPGPPPVAICAFGEHAAYAAAGFVPIDGAPGWKWRREPAITEAAELAIRAALPRVAHAAEVLSAWPLESQ